MLIVPVLVVLRIGYEQTKMSILCVIYVVPTGTTNLFFAGKLLSKNNLIKKC